MPATHLLDRRREIVQARIEAALSSGTAEQRMEKVIRFLAVTAGESLTPVMAAARAEEVERLVMYDRPASDPRRE